MQHRTIRIAVAALLAATGAAHADGLVSAQQTIFGMDCAPCAYGTEQALRKLSGVTAVSVSLNEGKASITFAPDSITTLEDVRRAIRHNGFTPKDAVVTIEGRLSKDGERYYLVTGRGQRYALATASPETLDALIGRPHVMLEGRVSADDASTVEIETIKPAAETY